MGHFFHAVGVFFHHLAAVQWQFLGYAIACHVVKLVLRAGAWRAIVNAAYPDARLKFRSAFGAYIAGVGVNSIVPARGGDVGSRVRNSGFFRRGFTIGSIMSLVPRGSPRPRRGHDHS